jgi:hypothetical protein
MRSRNPVAAGRAGAIAPESAQKSTGVRRCTSTQALALGGDFETMPTPGASVRHPADMFDVICSMRKASGEEWLK